LENEGKINMKKVIFLLIIFAFLIFPVNGLTTLPNANTTDEFTYTNSSFIDTKYNTDSTDSINYIALNFEIKNYPYSHVYTLNDSKNNILKVYYEYTLLSGLIMDDIIVNRTIILNNNIYTKYSDKETVLYMPFFNQMNTEKIAINGKTVILESELFYNSSLYTLNKNYFFNVVNIPNNSTNIINNEINFKYRDNGVSKIKYDIDNSYNSLNPVFKLLFFVLKAGIKIIEIVTLGYIISDIDYLNYQSYIIEPLTFLDSLIDYVLDMIHFIAVMGLLWVFSLISMIIFIYSYSTSKDILETFKNFASNEYYFINIVIIKPLLWFYEKFVSDIIQKIRG